MKRKVKIYLGPPGTGKTKTLLDEVLRLVEAGIHPKRIAYLAFTRAAAEEAKRRVLELFPHFTEADFIWFRTIHSAAFRLHGLSRDEVMNKKHWEELGEILGTTFNIRADNTVWTTFEGGSLGDRCLKIHALSLAKGITLDEAWRFADEEQLAFVTVENFRKELYEYKTTRHLLDFTDMLELPKQILDVDALIVDEGQDLTLQQWGFVRFIGAAAKSIIIAGDDDQSIYTWAGADATAMLSFRGDRIILPKSFRLPDTVKNLAMEVVERISNRIPKHFASRGVPGTVQWVKDFGEAPISVGKWLLLARHHWQLTDAANACMNLGLVYFHKGKWSNTAEEIKAVIAYESLRRGNRVPYSEARLICSWITDAKTPARIPGLERYGSEEMGLAPAEDLPSWIEGLTRLSPTMREYIRSLRRNGQSLKEEGDIRLSTIHGAKGWEEDNVVLCLDVSKRVERMMRRGEDDETRVFFVGITRTKENLYLIQPKTERAFRI